MAKQLPTIVVRLSPATMALAHEMWRRDQQHRAHLQLARGNRPTSPRQQDELARVAADRPSHRDISELMFDVLRERLMAGGAPDMRVQELCFEVPDGDSEYCLSLARDTFRDKNTPIGGASVEAEMLEANARSLALGAYVAQHPPAAEPAPAADPPAKRTGKRGAS